MLGVTECDQGRCDTAFCSKLLRWSRKNQKRFSARFFLDIDVAPTHRFADAGAERLGDSLFGRKTRCQVTRWEFHGHRILNFAIGKNALEKTITKSINRSLNARALDKIDASTNHAHSVTPAEYPGIVGRALCLPGPQMATVAVVLQFWSECVTRSSWIFRHRSEHFFYGSIKPNPNSARHDGVTNVELGQTWNLIDKRDIFVVDAVAGIHL
jgi:hypothetical protein